MTTSTIPKPARAALNGVAVSALLVAALVAAHLPLLVQHARQLWLRPHYRFFPLVLAGAGVLAWLRLRGQPRSQPGRVALAVPALAAAWLVLAAAEVLSSSWLAAVAALTAVAALGYALGGGALCRRLFPVWVLLWLAVPPPLELDRDLILWLQGVTTRWSSGMLDLLGVFHLTAGHVVEIDGRRLLVDQACSGVNSLFSVLACALFLIFTAGRPPLHAALLLGAALAGVLVANVARVAVVALVLARWDLDWSSGWRHDALGLLFFAGAVGLIASADQLLGFLLTPCRLATPASLLEMQSISGGEPVQGTVPPAHNEAAPGPRRAKSICQSNNLFWLTTLAVPAYLLLLGGRALAQQWPEAEPEGDSVLTGLVAELDADALPERMGPWRRQSFQTLTRDTGNFFGERTHAWSYRHGERVAVLSLDYPFPAWHDLTRCYTGQGWRVEEETVQQFARGRPSGKHGPDSALATSREGPPGGFVAVRLSKPAYRNAYLLFCELNGSGQALRPRPGGARLSLFRHEVVGRSLWARLAGGTGGEIADPHGPIYQWQLVVESSAETTPAEADALRQMFTQALDRLWKRGE
jgi:exosortase